MQTHGPTTGGATHMNNGGGGTTTHGTTTGSTMQTHGPTTGGATTHGPTTGGATTHGPTTGGATTHGPTTGGANTHGPTTGGATTHGPTTGGATTHGPTTGGATTHGPTTGGATNMNTGGGGTTTHGPTTGGTMQTHGPTTGGATNMTNGGGGTTTHGPTTGGATTHGPTTGGATTHGPTTGGATTHGPTTGGATTHGPTTIGGTHATDGGITHGSAGTHATNGGITHGPANIGGAHAVTTSHNISSAHNSSYGSHSNIGNGLAPKGSSTHVAKNGGAITRRPNGRVSDVHDPKRGMDVHHGLNGNRSVHVDRPDHSHVFGERGRPGYVQRGYNYHGHDYGRRSYYYHGHEYSRFYRGYGYHGLHLDVYAPGFYFHPGFYGWAYHPWGVPIHYGWGWGGAPWYGYYGGFFAPAPVYPSAAFWLTDYIIAQNLQAAYAAHQEAGEAAPVVVVSGGGPAITPDVQQQVSDEVNSQIALENQEAQQNTQNQDVDPGSSGIARMLSDGHKHIFVVGSALDVVDSNQAECALSDGDVLALMGPPPPDAVAADLVVLASKGGNECGKTSTVTVQLTDLQEMQNHMRELIDQGLQELQSKQGQGGLPQAPPSAQGQPAPAAYADVAPPPEADAGTVIQQQTQQADQAEADVSSQATQPSDTPPSQ